MDFPIMEVLTLIGDSSLKSIILFPPVLSPEIFMNTGFPEKFGLMMYVFL